MHSSRKGGLRRSRSLDQRFSKSKQSRWLKSRLFVFAMFDLHRRDRRFSAWRMKINKKCSKVMEKMAS